MTGIPGARPETEGSSSLADCFLAKLRLCFGTRHASGVGIQDFSLRLRFRFCLVLGFATTAVVALNTREQSISRRASRYLASFRGIVQCFCSFRAKKEKKLRQGEGQEKRFPDAKNITPLKRVQFQLLHATWNVRRQARR